MGNSMKIRGKKIYSFILVFAFSISLAGCALTQTDKIKKNVWKNMDEGAKVYLKSSWQKGDIEPADAKFNPENPNKPGNEVTIFADIEGNIVALTIHTGTVFLWKIRNKTLSLSDK